MFHQIATRKFFVFSWLQSEGVGFEPTDRLLGRLISSHASANSDRIDDRFEYATNEALRSLDRDLSDLRGAGEAKNLAILKKLVKPEQWPWAEPLALSFVHYAADMVAIDTLGQRTGHLLGNGAARDAAEHLLKDIAKLEAEKAEKAAKR